MPKFHHRHIFSNEPGLEKCPRNSKREGKQYAELYSSYAIRISHKIWQSVINHRTASFRVIRDMRLYIIPHTFINKIGKLYQMIMWPRKSSVKANNVSRKSRLLGWLMQKCHWKWRICPRNVICTVAHTKNAPANGLLSRPTELYKYCIKYQLEKHWIQKHSDNFKTVSTFKFMVTDFSRDLHNSTQGLANYFKCIPAEHLLCCVVICHTLFENTFVLDMYLICLLVCHSQNLKKEKSCK